MRIRWLKYRSFFKKNMKNVRISSLDNLERQGSKLNEKRLKRSI